MPSGSLSHPNCCKNYSCKSQTCSCHSPRQRPLMVLKLPTRYTSWHGIGDSSWSDFNIFFQHHSLLYSNTHSIHHEWLPELLYLLLLLEFFPLPENPFLLSLLDLLLLSFRAKLKWQVLFKDFPTSSTSFPNTDCFFHLCTSILLFPRILFCTYWIVSAQRFSVSAKWISHI